MGTQTLHKPCRKARSVLRLVNNKQLPHYIRPVGWPKRPMPFGGMFRMASSLLKPFAFALIVGASVQTQASGVLFFRRRVRRKNWCANN